MRATPRTALIMLKIGLILGLLCMSGARPSDIAGQASRSLSGGELATPAERSRAPSHSAGAQTTARRQAKLPVAHWHDEQPYLGKMSSLPDYLQTDPAYGGLPENGRMYCGPVAVANSIMWLDEHGYDRLVPDTADRKKDQFELISLLGSSVYMDTAPESGTSLGGFLNGVHRYVLDRGYPHAQLAYQGWRDHGTAFGTGVVVPDLTWTKAGIRGTASAWLNIGWYTYDPESDEYTRRDGHWVTLAGYGQDDRLENPTYLVIHDPAWGTGTSIRNHYLLLERIEGGTLVGPYRGLPHDATGYYQVIRRTTLETAGMWERTVRAGATIGILDGVAVLDMPSQ
jgi:hypothetical protein